MKQTTVDSLLVARALMERATELAQSDDRHLASAGLVLIQDALEIAFYALLIERSVDEEVPLERKSFDELIGELKKAGIPVPKSGTLKVLNKQRVLTKHYAQLVEPLMIRNFLDAALFVLDSTVKAVIGRPLRDLFFADFLKDGPAKKHLKEAEKLIDGRQYFEAAVEVRKAVFLEFELPYCIHSWKDHEGPPDFNSLLGFSRGGWKAQSWKLNKSWVEKNVNEPTDYVQISPEQWRLDALEWGIHTAELSNIRRLTPAVFQEKASASWAIKIDLSAREHISTVANAKYCLDRAIAAILKKQMHDDSHRRSGGYAPLDAPEEYNSKPLYAKASTKSEVVHQVNNAFTYTFNEIVDGFDDEERFVRLTGRSKARDDDGPADYAFGYLQVRREIN
ncbi:hypothetical protein D0B54_03925 [Solimonas sp. K1W22B-7]|uniref:hypothetical protein n=1 Tax=Solimonas sp. K1W22B-7 TaxID=2303331 RepID=UPI000E332DFC|nr:hypothetical protein [Solimonas sp. K1W22B-7]AXQ27875.1 hypothetical protein D0B54_03925 [Solimonas sp. K1W22B-7]